MSARCRQYGREDVDFESWYSDWMKRLAATMTKSEIEKRLGICSRESSEAAKAHLRAIEATASMTSQSARRAHSRNVVAAAGEYKIALNGALEIYELFPERTKDADLGATDQ